MVVVAVQLSMLGIVSPAGVHKGAASIRPRRSFHCRSKLPCESLGRRARSWCWWPSNHPCSDCISRRCSHRRRRNSAPDDHFAAGPHCRVKASGSGCVGGARGRPTIGAGIVPAAGVQVIDPSRQIHPRRSFHCRSTLPCDSLGAAGALVVLVAVQLSVLGLYLPPVFK